MRLRATSLPQTLPTDVKIDAFNVNFWITSADLFNLEMGRLRVDSKTLVVCVEFYNTHSNGG